MSGENGCFTFQSFSRYLYFGTYLPKNVNVYSDQYTYDYNGNQTNDYLKSNTGIKYDHRNLITEFTKQDLNQDPPTTIKIRYKYDEAGNRTRKTIYRTQDENPSPITNGDNPTGWTITKDEYYSRDASGKEIAIYQSYNLDFWNVWGTGNEGRIKSTGMKYFYLKDHLGSIRAVINQNNVLVEAQDYDPWGHIARSWDSTSADYKFTGKEHDKESNYDYFGARYYDSRVGRWGSEEPLLNKYLSWSPFSYSYCNPVLYKDIDGRDARYEINGNTVNVYLDFYYSVDEKYKGFYNSSSINLLFKYLDEARELWNNAGKEVNYGGNSYEVKFHISYFLVGEDEIEKMNADMENNHSSVNFVKYFENEVAPGVRKNFFRIVKMGNNKKTPKYTGSHEFGHLIGLSHPFDDDSDEQKSDKSVMGYSFEREKPKAIDVSNFLDKLDWNKKIGVVIGDSKSEGKTK